MMDIIMTGGAGDTGSRFLAEQYRERLLSRLTPSFLNRASAFNAQPFPQEGQFCTPIAEGGVFAALWRLAEEAEVGLTVDQQKIPIRQETIEICELLDVSPYLLQSGGFLYLTESGENVGGTVIGRTNSSRDRVVIGLEGKRFLNRPGMDEIERLEKGKS